MADHHHPDQNGFQNGSGGIDPSMLLLNPNPPPLPSVATPLNIPLPSASSAHITSHTTDDTPEASPPMPSPEEEGPKFHRPFAFSEALPYSPFTSISPLETRIIPVPTLAAKAGSALLSRVVSHEEYDKLNANWVEGTSDHGLDDIHQLIANGRTPLYTFKNLPQASGNPDSSYTIPLPSGASLLSPVAKAIFEKANIPFRYPSPESPIKSLQNGGTSAAPSTTTTNSRVTPTKRSAPKSKAKESAVTAILNNPAVNISAANPPPAIETLAVDDATIDEVVNDTVNEPIVTPAADELAPVVDNTTSEPTKAPASIVVNTEPNVEALPKEEEDAEDCSIRINEVPPKNMTKIEIDIPDLPPAYAAEALTMADSPSSHAQTNGFAKSSGVNGETHNSTPQTHSSPGREGMAERGEFTIEIGGPPKFNPTTVEQPDDSAQDLFSDLDQRQRAGAAYDELHRLFSDIFEAESNPSRQPGSVPLILMTPDDEPTLTDAALRKAQSTIQKAITLGCFTDVPIEDLLHLQRLCDCGLRNALSFDYKLSFEAIGSEVDEWVAQLRHADIGLKAARLSLKIMSGGREDKQLYSENVIQSAVDIFKLVMDNVVVPIAELRSSGPTEKRFKQLAHYKKIISPIFMAAQRLFSGLATLVQVIDLSELVVNSLEYCASNLIFVENAHTERDSVLGVQAFDGLRLSAMDMLSQIFVKKPMQRRGIFDDILTSLEKLPVGKLSARQFKLADGKSIQPVSALIMRLVQASAGRVVEKEKSAGILDQPMTDGDELIEEPTKPLAPHVPTITTEEQGAYDHELSIQELSDLVTPLNGTAYFHAQYVIKFIVERAQTSSKSADTPYRNLLDLFVEDFTTCLETPDWPAAELLSRLLMMAMFKLTESDKVSAPVKNMAMEELGVIGASIAKLRSVVNKSSNSADSNSPDDLDRILSKLAGAALGESPPAEEFVAWKGPFSPTMEYLEDRSSQDPHLKGAISYTAADWAFRICRLYAARSEAATKAASEAAAAGTADDGHDTNLSRENRILERQNRDLGRAAFRLRMMIEDGRGMSGNRSFNAVSPAQAKLSYAIVTLRSPLGGSFNDIINILAMGMGSDQATVRSKSLKSITEVLEIDPSIFDNPASIVGRLIQDCCADSSVQVRDSALGLVSRAITLRPHLEGAMMKTITDRFVDSGVGVRKRAIKIARDCYLRNQSRAIRSDIANGLLHRIQDPDEGVRELARLTIEEIWVTPFAETVAADTAGTASSSDRTSLTDHVSLILETVKNGSVMPVLDKVFQTILAPSAKSASANFEVCKRIVGIMCDLVDTPESDDPNVPSGREALQLMMIFAKADPKLFTFEQIRLLKPHVASVKDVQTADDMAVARAVVVIYTRVLPQLSSVMKPFLEEVRANLMPSVVNVSRTLLDDVMSCIWVVSVLLKDKTGLVRIVMSALRGVQNQERLSEKDPLFEKKAKRFLRYALIVGMAGKHCDLDSEVPVFQNQFPKINVTTVSKLMVDILCPFATPAWPLAIRRIALDAIGLICQSWPRNFVLKNVYTVFHAAFNQHDPSLEVKIMQSLKEFLTKEEQRSEAGAAKKRTLTVMGGSNHDDVASATTQRFMGDITRIALASVSEEAYLAAEILASISRQGLVHPKETGVTMITLETSTMPKLSDLAYREHRALHNKYETVLEREYAKAAHSVFQYQRDVIGDLRGATTEPFTSKLHQLINVVKDSKAKNRGRMLEKMCAQIDFEPNKLDVSQPVPKHLEFSRFMIENLAFLEYVTVGELQSTVSAMEKTVHTTGVSISQAIEADIFDPAGEQNADIVLNPIKVDPLSETGEVLPPPPPPGPALKPDLAPQRLKQIATGCMVLLMLWEARTFLCRQYGLKREGGNKGKNTGRDMTRAPIKVQGITGDKYWEEMSNIMKGLDSQELMAARCRSLVELLTVDSDFKIEEGEGNLDDEDPSTPSGDEDEPGPERGRKRKAGASTPVGRKKRPRSNSQPKKRGRPRKNPLPEPAADPDFDGF